MNNKLQKNTEEYTSGTQWQYSESYLIQLVNDYGGNISAMAKELESPRSIIYKYMERYPLLKSTIKEQRQNAPGIIEDILLDKALTGDLSAIRLYLQEKKRKELKENREKFYPKFNRQTRKWEGEIPAVQVQMHSMRTCDDEAKIQTIESLENKIQEELKANKEDKNYNNCMNANAQIMAIINITPDSFSDGGQYLKPDKALKRIIELAKEDNIHYIDIGAESTRPSATLVDETEEWQRLETVLDKIPKSIKSKISIDTRKASIAKKALEKDYRIINDVSGLEDTAMTGSIAQYPDAKIIINHHRGLPPSYTPEEINLNIMDEIIEYFEQKLKYAKDSSVKESQIILDPGLGFGKNTKENLLILDNLQKLKTHFNLPILIGASRKRFIKELFGTDNESLDKGTQIINKLAINNGADIIRTHI